MNMLRKELAPIGAQGWSLIEAAAKESLSANLSGRKFVDFDGPHGIAHAAVPTGRIKLVKDDRNGELGYGLHQVLPLVEVRVPFELGIWELDDLARGAADIDLAPLLDACRKAAAFEEAALYDGLGAAGIVGLHACAGEALPLTLERDAFVDAVGEAQQRLIAAGVAGPAHLVVNPQICKFLNRSAPGGTLRKLIAGQIGGEVIFSAAVKDALLVAARGGDAILSVGQDFAVGYHHQSDEKVGLFLTESFTFRMLAPEALVKFSLH